MRETDMVADSVLPQPLEDQPQGDPGPHSTIQEELQGDPGPHLQESLQGDPGPH